MTHDSAVRIVVSLVPKIEKQGAEAVLAAYAREEDLPPAQLEKLAQVFNTLSTISHIEKAADRGSAAKLIDVPTLVVSYAADLGVQKAAAPVARITHDMATVDLMAALRGELIDQPVAEIAKAASAPAPVGVTASQVREIAFDIECDAMLEAEKAAGDVRVLVANDREYDFTLAELDALCERTPEAVKDAFDWLAKSARNGDVVKRLDYSVQRPARNFNAGTRLGEAAVRLVDAHTTRELMHKIAAGVQDPFAAAVLDPQTTTRTYEDDEDLGEPEPRPEQPTAPHPAEPAPEPPPAPTNRRERDDDSGEERGSGGGGKDKGDKGGKGSSGTKDPDYAGAAADVANLALAPVSAAADAVSTAAGAADNALTAITGKERVNKRQQSTDISVEDIRRAINIRRMIGTDPVLREADPRDVLEVYNAIARTNPDIASNPASMKLLLREAISYEGLTLDSQKQLADIRKTTAEAESKSGENDRRRYSAGGSELPQLIRLPGHA